MCEETQSYWTISVFQPCKKSFQIKIAPKLKACSDITVLPIPIYRFPVGGAFATCGGPFVCRGWQTMVEEESNKISNKISKFNKVVNGMGGYEPNQCKF